MRGEPAFFEIGVPDAKRAKAFYGQLFNWTFHPMGGGDQAWVETPTIRGGLHDNDPESRIDIFFAVPDIDAAVTAVRELGGHADDPRPEEPGFGRFAFCRDDQGVRFGLQQPPAAPPTARRSQASHPRIQDPTDAFKHATNARSSVTERRTQYVPDADQIFDRAVHTGATVPQPDRRPILGTVGESHRPLRSPVGHRHSPRERRR